MHFEKEDKGSSQENTAFGDTDLTDSQIVFAWMMENGNFLLLKPQKVKRKNPLFLSVFLV